MDADCGLRRAVARCQWAGGDGCGGRRMKVTQGLRQCVRRVNSEQMLQRGWCVRLQLIEQSKTHERQGRARRMHRCRLLKRLARGPPAIP